MARVIFRITCLLLALSVEHGVQATASTTETDQSWKEAMLDMMHKVKNSLPQGQSSYGGGLGPVVAQLVAEQTKMQNQIAASSSAMSSMKAELQAVKFMGLKTEQVRVEQTKMQNQIAASSSAMSSMEAELQAVKNMSLKMDQVRVEEQTKMQNQIAASSSAMSSMKIELQAVKNMSLEMDQVRVEEQTQMQNQIAASSSAMSSMKAELQAVKDTGLKTDQGSTFVRWGRKTCPANTTLVYSGVAGGKRHDSIGSGTDRLCLTRSPQFDNTHGEYYGHLYGAQYEGIPGHFNHDVPCSVCRAPQSTTIMMAGTFTCPQGWTAQYTGHLTSQYGKKHYATEYACLDGDPENDHSGGLKDEAGLFFYYVIAVCGSLPCPPYENGKVVTCVVCSK